MNNTDLHQLAIKFCDQCELTADITREDALTYRMFLSRFLAYVEKERRRGLVFPPNDGNVVQFDLREEKPCDADGP